MLHFLLYWYKCHVSVLKKNIFINNVLYTVCKFSVALFQDKTVTLSQHDLFYVMFLILIVVSAQFSTLLVNSCYMHNFILILRKKEKTNKTCL